jgi:putative ABC transport system permease protein
VILKRLAAAIGFGVTAAVLALVQVAALLLSPFRIGRLLQTISIPRMREHRLRTTLTVLGVALGVSVVIAVVIVNRSIIQGVTSTVDDLAGKTDLQVSAGTSGFDETLIEKVRAVPGVYRSTPVLQQTARVRDPNAAGERVLMLGIDMLGEDDRYFRNYESKELEAIRKDPVMFLNSPTNVIISRTLAKNRGYELHDKIPIATSSGIQQFDIWGFLEEEGAGKAFGGSVAIMYYAAMQVAFDRASNVDRIDIAIAKEADAAQVTRELATALGPGFMIERPSRKGERVENMLAAVQTALTMASLIALVVGAFLIHNTMSISVVQRKKELGTLRAIGTTRAQVLRLVTLEGVLLGTVGSLLGLGLGVALSRLALRTTLVALNETYLQLAATELHIDWPLLLACFVLGVLGSTLASALAARRAGQVSPAATLRGGTLVSTGTASFGVTRSDVLGACMLGLAALLLPMQRVGTVQVGAFGALMALIVAGALFVPRVVQLIQLLFSWQKLRFIGLEAQLASDNLPRDLGRTATTAGALMVGVAMTVGFGTFIGSFVSSLDEWTEQTLPGDLFITSAASLSGASLRNVPMADTLGDKLLQVPGVDYLRRIRIVEMPYHGVPVKLISTEMDVFVRKSRLQLLEGDVATTVAAMKKGAVTVSENFSRRFNVHRGDRVVMSVKDGTRAFDVAGVNTDYSSDLGTVLFDRAVYNEAWNDTRVDTYEVHLRAGTDVEATRNAINQRHGEQHDLFVLTNGEFRGQIVKITQQVFALLRALELVAIAAAALGVVNALLANVLDRMREIGVLRAIGMLRRQLRKLIMLEAGMVGLIGAFSGVVVGTGIGYVMLRHVNEVQTGWYFPYQLSLPDLLMLPLLTIPVAALAGWYPAREAANLVVADALEYE